MIHLSHSALWELVLAMHFISITRKSLEITVNVRGYSGNCQPSEQPTIWEVLSANGDPLSLCLGNRVFFFYWMHKIIYALLFDHLWACSSINIAVATGAVPVTDPVLTNACHKRCFPFVSNHFDSVWDFFRRGEGCEFNLIEACLKCSIVPLFDCCCNSWILKMRWHRVLFVSPPYLELCEPIIWILMNA